MATIDYKEKLRLAKEALESGSYDKETIEYIFPELAESEDEKMANIIRESLANVTSENKLGEYGLSHKDVSDWLEKRGEKKPDEDRYMEGYLNGINDASKTQKSDAWSEEDEEHLERILKELENQRQRPLNSPYLDKIESDYNWLKSLRPQPQWKPSEEQMEYLAKAITTLGDEGNCKTASMLNDLRVELKKLMEE